MRYIRRKLTALLTVCLLCALLSGYAAVDGGAADQTAAYGKQFVYVGGVPKCRGYRIDGENYIPLRSFCGALNLGAVVIWDGGTETMQVTMTHLGQRYTVTARAGDIYLYVNDRIVYLERPVVNYRGALLVPILPVCAAFGVACEAAAERVSLEPTNLQICASGSEVYPAEDLKWLSHIINAEAGNQSLEGKICVGNVVLNRVADENFPDTVRDVVFSPNQFCPVKSGTIYCTPDADAIAAAKLCLEGVNLAGESTYFVNPVTGSTAWFRQNLTYLMTVGEHDFYY